MIIHVSVVPEVHLNQEMVTNSFSNTNYMFIKYLSFWKLHCRNATQEDFGTFFCTKTMQF